MPEILSQYIRILEKEQSNADFIEILRQEQKCILEVEHDYNVSFENYRLFEHVIRNLMWWPKLFENEKSIQTHTRIVK